MKHLTDWSLAIAAGVVILLLNAYLEHEHPTTETAALTAQVVSDRAAERVALKGTP